MTIDTLAAASASRIDKSYARRSIARTHGRPRALRNGVGKGTMAGNRAAPSWTRPYRH
jgi:hypothetical protein